jgi:hypothetical protein
MSLHAALAVIGTLAGLAYAGLGIAASRHLHSATAVDRVAGWSLWWFVESGRYSPRGQALCRLGAVAVAVGLISWVAWFVLRKG